MSASKTQTSNFRFNVLNDGVKLFDREQLVSVGCISNWNMWRGLSMNVLKLDNICMKSCSTLYATSVVQFWITFLKSAWRHGIIDYYDKPRNTPYFAPWHFGERLGVYRWPQCKYKRGFYKSHSRLSKIMAGNRCRNIWTMQNVTNRSLIDSNKLGTRS